MPALAPLADYAHLDADVNEHALPRCLARRHKVAQGFAMYGAMAASLLLCHENVFEPLTQAKINAAITKGAPLHIDLT